MAKGKKSKSKGFKSQGQRPNVSKAVTKANRRAFVESPSRELAQQDAWRKGKRVMLTIPNPNKEETAKRFIRVSAREVWGDPKANFFNFGKQKKGDN